jgi:hypothetical protein
MFSNWQSILYAICCQVNKVGYYTGSIINIWGGFFCSSKMVKRSDSRLYWRLSKKLKVLQHRTSLQRYVSTVFNSGSGHQCSWMVSIQQCSLAGCSARWYIISLVLFISQKFIIATFSKKHGVEGVLTRNTSQLLLKKFIRALSMNWPWVEDDKDEMWKQTKTLVSRVNQFAGFKGSWL